MVPVSHYVVQWFRRNGHFDDIEAVWGWIGWWIVGGHFYHGRVGSIFNVSRHFSYPRDAKFCEEYDSKGLVLITSLWGGGLVRLSRDFVMVHSLFERWWLWVRRSFSCVGILLVDWEPQTQTLQSSYVYFKNNIYGTRMMFLNHYDNNIMVEE